MRRGRQLDEMMKLPSTNPSHPAVIMIFSSGKQASGWAMFCSSRPTPVKRLSIRLSTFLVTKRKETIDNCSPSATPSLEQSRSPLFSFLVASASPGTEPTFHRFGPATLGCALPGYCVDSSPWKLGTADFLSELCLGKAVQSEKLGYVQTDSGDSARLCQIQGGYK